MPTRHGFEQIGYSDKTVSKWETGDAMPDLNKLLALADALEISLDVLCGREGFPPSASSPHELCGLGSCLSPRRLHGSNLVQLCEDHTDDAHTALGILPEIEALSAPPSV